MIKTKGVLVWINELSKNTVILYSYIRQCKRLNENICIYVKHLTKLFFTCICIYKELKETKLKKRTIVKVMKF